MAKNRKTVLKVVKKGVRCGRGWTAVEIKVGRKMRRACLHRTAVPKRGDSVATMLFIEGLGVLASALI